MTDESPLSRALRLAMGNHVAAYGGRNALDQGDYGYGTPVTYTEANPLSSSGLQQKGPWMREYMPSTLADLLSQILTYAPMAVPAMRGRVMGNGLAPQDFAIANRIHQTAPEGAPSPILGGLSEHQIRMGVRPRLNESPPTTIHESAAGLRMLHGGPGGSMRQFKANTPQDMSAYVALPEEVGFWAKQVPANAPSTEFARPTPSGNAHRDAIRMDEWKRLMRSEEFRPFDVISGGKE